MDFTRRSDSDAASHKTNIPVAASLACGAEAVAAGERYRNY